MENEANIITPDLSNSPGESNDQPNEATPLIPKDRTIIHNSITNNKAIYVSIDIVTGGNHFGIIQVYTKIV